MLLHALSALAGGILDGGGTSVLDLSRASAPATIRSISSAAVTYVLLHAMFVFGALLHGSLRLGGAAASSVLYTCGWALLTCLLFWSKAIFGAQLFDSAVWYAVVGARFVALLLSDAAALDLGGIGVPYDSPPARLLRRLRALEKASNSLPARADRLMGLRHAVQPLQRWVKYAGEVASGALLQPLQASAVACETPMWVADRHPPPHPDPFPTPGPTTLCSVLAYSLDCEGGVRPQRAPPPAAVHTVARRIEQCAGQLRAAVLMFLCKPLARILHLTTSACLVHEIGCCRGVTSARLAACSQHWAAGRPFSFSSSQIPIYSSSWAPQCWDT